MREMFRLPVLSIDSRMPAVPQSRAATRLSAVTAALALAVCSALVLAMPGCSPAGRLDPGAGAEVQAAAPELPLQQPQASADGFDLPAPSTLLRGYQARRASYQFFDLTQLGSDFDLYSLPRQHLAADGTRALFSPAWGSELGREFARLAYGIWAFHLEDYDLSGTLLLDWATAPGELTPVWVGFGDVGADCWDWYPCTAEGVTTPGFTPYIDPADDVMLVAVVLLGSDEAALNTLSVGSGISGDVRDPDGNPIAYARAQITGLGNATTDSLGHFSILGLMPDEHLPVRFEAPGYQPTVRIYAVQKGAVRYQRITLLPAAAIVAIDATAGGEVPVSGGGTLTLPPAALVDHNGAALSGTLQARLAYLDPSDAVQFAAAPGDWDALLLDDTAAKLRSYGLVSVEINDGLGGLAQLAAGQSATLKVPVPAAWQDEAPDDVQLYTFDEGQGLWLEEEEVPVLAGTHEYYETAVSHFSFINIDAWSDIACLRIKVELPDGMPAVGAYVNCGYVDCGSGDRAYTDHNGIACINALHGEDGIAMAYLRNMESAPTSVAVPVMVQSCADGEGACPLQETITLHAPPVVQVSASPRKGNPPLEVEFDATASTGETNLTFEWDYDGLYNGYDWTSSGTSTLRSYTYTQLGSFFATVRATDGNGLSSIGGVWVHVVRDPVGDGRGEWWMFGRDTLHTHRSNYNGPRTPGLRWTLADAGQTSVVLGGDRELYLGNGRYLWAVTPDGALDWEYDCEATVQTTPALDSAGRIYLGTQNGKVRCIEPDGTQAWYATLSLGNYIAGSPAIGPDGDIYFGCSDYNLFSIRPADGSTRWQRAAFDAVDAAPCIGPDGNIYCASVDKFVYCYNENGTLQWKYETGDAVSTSLSIGDDGTVYVGSLDGKLYALDPLADDASRLKWSFQAGGAVDSGAAIAADGTVYFGCLDNCIYAVGADGALRWQYATGNWVVGSPAVGADGTVYVGSLDGYLYALDPGGWLIWRLDAGAGIYSSPAIGPDGTLYFTAGTTLCAIGP